MLDLAGPHRCASCRTCGSALCARCAEALPLCPPLQAPPPLTRLAAGFVYDSTTRPLVLGLKLRSLRGNAGPLVEAMCRAAWRDGIEGDVVTWVPGARPEARRRGYDHAEVLGRAVAARLGLPARPLLALRRAKTDQTELDAAQRRENMKGAFVARSALQKVVLVDDVMTTGATICTCAGALMGVGAASVTGLVGCRA